VNGHHAAIPTAPVSVRPLLAEFSREAGGDGLSTSVQLTRAALSATLSTSPPGSTLLRI
jgi:hypothetical protein